MNVIMNEEFGKREEAEVMIVFSFEPLLVSTWSMFPSHQLKKGILKTWNDFMYQFFP